MLELSLKLKKNINNKINQGFQSKQRYLALFSSRRSYWYNRGTKINTVTLVNCAVPHSGHPAVDTGTSTL